MRIVVGWLGVASACLLSAQTPPKPVMVEDVLKDVRMLKGISVNEFMATMGSHYDLARFGSERVGFSPRQCDLLMVMGTIAKKMGPVVKQVYLQMAEPRWVLAMGACASSGGIFDTYSVLQGIDQIIPVDVYIPGCPPRPEAVIDGIMKIQDLIGKESLRRRNSEKYKQLMESYGIQ